MLRAHLSPEKCGLAATLRAIPGVSVKAESDRIVVGCEPDLGPRLARNYGIIWLCPVDRRSARAVDNLLPTDLAARLRPWQREGVTALVTRPKRGLIWTCGAGKTATLLAAAQATGAQRVLIFTRAIGRDVYARDALWAAPGRKIAVVIGRGGETTGAANAIRRANQQLADLRKRGANVYVVGTVAAALTWDPWAVAVTWEVLADHVPALAHSRWDLAIADESHMIRGRLADRSRAAFDAAECVDLRWISTATPVRDRLRDLSAQLRWMAPRGWGRSDWRWVHRYCDAQPGRWGGLDTAGVSNTDELKERLEYWWDVRTRQEIAALMPAVTYEMIRVPVGDVGGALEGHGPIAASGLEAAIAQAAAAKSDAVIDRAASALIGGEKVLVVGIRRSWVPQIEGAIVRAVEPIRHVRERLWARWCHGGVSVSDRQALAREYMAQSRPALLVATIDSISESIDLHDTDRMILAALPYTPGQIVQIRGRVCRLNGVPVSIDCFIAEGTIDEEIERVVLGKFAAIEQAAAGTEATGLRSAKPVETESEIMARLEAWLAARRSSIAGASLEDSECA